MKRLTFFLITLFILNISSASAIQFSQASASINVATSPWAVVAVEQNQPPLLAPFHLTWSVSNSSAHDYFSFRNIGGVTANNFLVSISQQRISGNAPANEIFFERCVGGIWNTTNNSCSGSVVLIGLASDSTISFSAIFLAPNDEVAMRARTAINNRNQFQTTLSVQISRNDVRAKQVVHS